MTKTFCDVCKKEMAEGVLAEKIRVGDKLHDFCGECGSALKKLLEDTGTPAIDFVPLQPLINNPFQPAIPSYPSMPSYPWNTGPVVPGISTVSMKDGLTNSNLPTTGVFTAVNTSKPDNDLMTLLRSIKQQEEA